MAAPSVFISYSHDSPSHKAWVLKLASDLRTNGIDVSLDQWDLALGQDTSLFMQRGIAGADRVLLVCSEKYVQKAEAGAGGVGYERLIVTAEVIESIDTKKFIPVIRENTSPKKVPNFLGPRLYIYFSHDANYQAQLLDLIRELAGVAASAKPPLGQLPFSGQPPANTESSRITSPTGAASAGGRLLDQEWYKKEHTVAESGLAKLQLAGSMELRFGLHSELNKSQVELLASVRKANVHTFGWPIGVMLEGRDEYRARPYGDGIRAEVSIESGTLSGGSSYDYWALRSNGDFFLEQSLFEDDRAKGAIFFNTRIVRVTESLIFASNLYTELGAPPETRLSVRVTHRGLSDRVLASSSPNRLLFQGKKSFENEAQSEIVVVLGEMRGSLVADVQRILAPLFMLFDFQEFGPQIYADIVTRFEKGEVT